jgi:histidinol-phosphate aminotransferase
MNIGRRNLLKQIGGTLAAGSVLAPARALANRSGESFSDGSPEAHGAVHLDRNENGYGASPKAIAAVKEAAAQASLYSDGAKLREAIAQHHHAKPEQIILGCGSSDVLRMAAATFAGQGTTLISPSPTCDLIANFARAAGAKIQEVELRKDHGHDLSGMLDRAKSSSTGGLLYVCNPNSPTGSLTARKEIDEFLEAVPANFHVVIDEAYHDYAGGSGSYTSFIDKPSANPRVIVTRTFSTSYGLAGARVGYGVASAEAVKKMAQANLPYPISGPSAAAAIAALGDHAFLESCIKKNFDDRQEFMNQVNARMLRALDSHANFVCVNVMHPANEIYDHYVKHNVFVMPPIPSMPTYLRVSLGSPKAVAEFWRVFDLLGFHPMAM